MTTIDEAREDEITAEIDDLADHLEEDFMVRAARVSGTVQLPLKEVVKRVVNEMEARGYFE